MSLHRCCRHSFLATVAQSAKLVLVLLNLCCGFLAASMLTAGLLIASSSSELVVAHMWNSVKQLPANIGITTIAFNADTAYYTIFQLPANAIAAAGFCCLCLSACAVAAAMTDSLTLLATYFACCFIGLLAALAAQAILPAMNSGAVESLKTEMLGWIGAYSSANSSSGTVQFGSVFLDYLQQQRRCCGWNSYKDYGSVPYTCCQLDAMYVLADVNCLSANSTAGWYDNGCGQLYANVLQSYQSLLAIAIILLIVAVIAAGVILHRIRKEQNFMAVLRETAMETD